MLALLLAGAASVLPVPLIDRLWLFVVVLAFAQAMGLTAGALNFALVTGLVRSRMDIGKVSSITVPGGNTFGRSAPIIPGYIVSLSGSFDRTFIVAGLPPPLGATATFFVTRRPIQPQAARVPRFA